MMRKRGFSQIDWVLSIGIFLLYIAWFFIFIRPIALQQESPNLVDNIKEKLDDEIYWTVISYPIFIESGYALPDEPIIVDIDFNNESHYYLQNKSFFFFEDNLIFLKSLNAGQNLEELIYSTENYDQYSQITDLNIEKGHFSVTDFLYDFNDTSVEFDGQKIYGWNTYYEGEEAVKNLSSNISSIAATHAFRSQALNITDMVFAFNQRIYTFFSTDLEVKQEFEIYDYEEYYFAEEDEGTIFYGGTCYDSESDMIEFFTEDSVMLILLSEESNISFCTTNTTIELEIETDVEGEMLQKMIFYKGNPEDFEIYNESYYARLGLPNNLEGLSYQKLQILNNSRYSTVKKRFTLGDFRITVTNVSNDETLFDFGGMPYDTANVYAKERRDFLLDKYGNFEDARISVQSWT